MLKPLKKRKSKAQLARRAERIAVRKAEAAAFHGWIRETAPEQSGALTPGFFGRMKWLLTGR